MGVHRISATEMPQDRSAIDTSGFTATVGEFDAPEGHGDWHHHGDHHIVAYVISGNVRVESGDDGNVVTEAGPGDLVHIEPGTVHRETYSGKMKVVGFGIGSGPGRREGRCTRCQLSLLSPRLRRVWTSRRGIGSASGTCGRNP